MQYYLIQLSYTAEAWLQQVEQTVNITDRLAAVKALIAALGGSLAHYHFFEDGTVPNQAPLVTNGKFVGIGGDDLIAILAMPDLPSATAFSMAVAAESGVKSIRLTPITPIADAVASMTAASSARKQTGYSAPGGSGTSWNASTATAAARKRRASRGGKG